MRLAFGECVLEVRATVFQPVGSMKYQVLMDTHGLPAGALAPKPKALSSLSPGANRLQVSSLCPFACSYCKALSFLALTPC